MSSLRPIGFALLAAVLLGPPFASLAELARRPAGWAAWAEADRIRSLAANSAALAALTVVLAVPVGTALAVTVGRLPVRGKTILRALTALGLFVPLPVYAVAWQVVLGSWLPAALPPGQVEWRPWLTGLLPAAGVHAAAAVPWVAWVVAAALRTTDRALEDEAAATGGPAAVRHLVLAPRLATAVTAAAGWAAVQTLTEIPVTDAMMVRTLAEEAYTQIVGFPAGVAGAVAVSVPAWLLAVAVAVPVARRLADRFVATGEPTEPRPPVGSAPMATGFAWLVAVLFAGLPVAAMVWKAGLDAGGWSIGSLGVRLEQVVRSNGLTLLDSAAAAAGCGLVTAAAAAWACWAARDSRFWTGVLIGLAAAAWVTPGPLVGFGLTEVIGRLVDLEAAILARLGVAPTFPPVRSALYDQPSPLPGVWAAAVRFFPVAVAIVWPAVRAVPWELVEAAACDGAGPVGRWRLAGRPLVLPVTLAAAVAVGVLALGEVSASKLVVPPGRAVYVLELFAQTHYGAESTVAAMSLVQLAATAAGVFALSLVTSGRSARPAR